MRWLAVILIACGGGKGGGDVWDVRAVAFAEAICQSSCVPADAQEDCLVDVLMDMDRARTEIPVAEQSACIECMRVQTQVVPQFVAAGCQTNAAIDAQVLAACDLPGSDFDGDGDPGNDFDEACAGFP